MAKVIPMKKDKSIVDSLSYDWNVLETAQVGLGILEENPKSPMAGMVLEKILKDTGVSDPWVVATLSDPKNPEVMKKAFENQSKVYSVGLAEQTIEDRLNYHRKTIESYLGEDTKKLYEKVGDFLDNKYVDIAREYSSAQYVLGGAEKGVKTSKEDIEKAKKTKEKYEKVYTIVSMLEEKRRNEIRESIEKTYQKAVFNSITADEPKEEKKVVNG